MHNQSGRKSSTNTPKGILPLIGESTFQSDSPYKGGSFHFNLDLPENFPFKAPSVIPVPRDIIPSRLSLLPFPFIPHLAHPIASIPLVCLICRNTHGRTGEIHDEDLSPWDQ